MLIIKNVIAGALIERQFEVAEDGKITLYNGGFNGTYNEFNELSIGDGDIISWDRNFGAYEICPSVIGHTPSNKKIVTKGNCLNIDDKKSSGYNEDGSCATITNLNIETGEVSHSSFFVEKKQKGMEIKSKIVRTDNSITDNFTKIDYEAQKLDNFKLPEEVIKDKNIDNPVISKSDIKPVHKITKVETEENNKENQIKELNRIKNIFVSYPEVYEEYKKNESIKYKAISNFESNMKKKINNEEIYNMFDYFGASEDFSKLINEEVKLDIGAEEFSFYNDTYYDRNVTQTFDSYYHKQAKELYLNYITMESYAKLISKIFNKAKEKINSKECKDIKEALVAATEIVRKEIEEKNRKGLTQDEEEELLKNRIEYLNNMYVKKFKEGKPQLSIYFNKAKNANRKRLIEIKEEKNKNVFTFEEIKKEKYIKTKKIFKLDKTENGSETIEWEVDLNNVDDIISSLDNGIDGFYVDENLNENNLEILTYIFLELTKAKIDNSKLKEFLDKAFCHDDDEMKKFEEVLYEKLRRDYNIKKEYPFTSPYYDIETFVKDFEEIKSGNIVYSEEYESKKEKNGEKKFIFEIMDNTEKVESEKIVKNLNELRNIMNTIYFLSKRGEIKEDSIKTINEAFVYFIKNSNNQKEFKEILEEFKERMIDLNNHQGKELIKYYNNSLKELAKEVGIKDFNIDIINDSSEDLYDKLSKIAGIKIEIEINKEDLFNGQIEELNRIKNIFISYSELYEEYESIKHKAIFNFESIMKKKINNEEIYNMFDYFGDSEDFNKLIDEKVKLDIGAEEFKVYNEEIDTVRTIALNIEVKSYIDYIKMKSYVKLINKIINEAKEKINSKECKDIKEALVAATEIVRKEIEEKNRKGLTQDEEEELLKNRITDLNNIIKNKPKISEKYKIALEVNQKRLKEIEKEKYIKTKKIFKLDKTENGSETIEWEVDLDNVDDIISSLDNGIDGFYVDENLNENNLEILTYIFLELTKAKIDNSKLKEFLDKAFCHDDDEMKKFEEVLYEKLRRDYNIKKEYPFTSPYYDIETFVKDFEEIKNGNIVYGKEYEKTKKEDEERKNRKNSDIKNEVDIDNNEFDSEELKKIAQNLSTSLNELDNEEKSKTLNIEENNPKETGIEVYGSIIAPALEGAKNVEKYNAILNILVVENKLSSIRYNALKGKAVKLINDLPKENKEKLKDILSKDENVEKINNVSKNSGIELGNLILNTLCEERIIDI